MVAFRDMKHSPKFLQIVDESKKQIKEMTVEELVKRQKAGEHLEFVDVREDN